ncbi:MAG: hypothetical protein SGBAC_003035 [Bacillariaceae sp.]
MPPLSNSHEALAGETVYPGPRKSTRFEDRVKVQTFQCVSDAEKENYWVRENDFHRIRQDCINVLHRSRHPLRDGQTEFRGLEHKTPMGAQHRSSNRARARQAVLDEQQYQSEKGVQDPEYMAALYKTITHRSRVEANVMGIRDEMAARK